MMAAAGPQSYAALHGFLASWLGLALMLGWTFSLFYHLCNGIRHLFWDAGYGFELEAIYASGWAVVVNSAGLTLGAWIIVSACGGSDDTKPQAIAIRPYARTRFRPRRRGPLVDTARDGG